MSSRCGVGNADEPSNTQRGKGISAEEKTVPFSSGRMGEYPCDCHPA